MHRDTTPVLQLCKNNNPSVFNLPEQDLIQTEVQRLSKGTGIRRETGLMVNDKLLWSIHMIQAGLQIEA